MTNLPETTSSPQASVVVPCYRCEDVLPHQLEALSRQRLEEPWEVILVDNGGNANLAELAASHRHRLPQLRVVDAHERQGAAFARNAGAAAARGELLLFVDADDEVGEGWLATMVAALAEHPFVACRMDFDKLNPEDAARARSSLQQEGLQRYTYPDFLPHAAGGTLGIRKSVHEAVGGFDTSLLMLEDTDYCWRVQLAGYDFAFVPAAVVHYRLRETLRGAAKQAFAYGEYNVKLYRRYRAEGMGAITVWRGLRAWYYLLRSLPRLFDGRARARTVWSLVWRLGRLYGSLRYRVFAI